MFVSLITFTLMHFTPGGPWDTEKAISAQAIANLNARYNLDKPAWQQYLLHMSNALRGDLGPSYTYQDRSVTQIILGGLPNTASLGLFAAIVAICVGVPLGVIAATRQNSAVDYTALAFGTVFASVPSFVLGFVMIIIFALTLHLVPTSGWGKPAQYVLRGLAPTARRNEVQCQCENDDHHEAEHERRDAGEDRAKSKRRVVDRRVLACGRDDPQRHANTDGDNCREQA